MSKNEGLRNKKNSWLFDEKRLHRKLNLFASITLPSVTNAKAKPDEYWILIDPLIPKNIEEEMCKLISPYPWIYLKKVDPGFVFKASSLGGLVDLREFKTKYILTTNIDDDDALHHWFLGDLQEKARSLIEKKIVFHWLGTDRIKEWDHLFVRGAPLGFIKPNSGGASFVFNLGYSVLTRIHVDAPTTFAVAHDNCVSHLSKKPFAILVNKNRFKTRLKLLYRAIKMKELDQALTIIFGGNIMSNLGSELNKYDHALITNHNDNLQQIRFGFGVENRCPTNVSDLAPFNIKIDNLYNTECRVM